MTASIRAFLENLIDYAGLFPPAELHMRDAVATYARHLASDHAWMVGRFVCPLHRLEDFAAKGEEPLRRFAPVKVAGLASSMNDVSAMMRVAGADATLARVFERNGWGLVDVLEVRLPDELVDGDPSEIPLALERFEGALRVGGMRPERIFYEVGRSRNWNDRVERCVIACSREGHRGLKIRCGGVTHDAYPTVEEVSDAIAVCSRLGVPYKATAGMHHPARHVLSESGIAQHGFVNVFAAGVLATKLDPFFLKSLIEDPDLTHFDFLDDRLVWSGHEATIGEVRAARSSFAISFGSCDVDEPMEDLRNAGLL